MLEKLIDRHSQKRASCNKSVDILQEFITSRHQDSHGLRQLVDNKSVASCQKACCKLSTDLLQVDCYNLSSTDLLQADNRLVASRFNNL